MSERKWEIVKSAVYNNIFADTLFRPIVSDFKLLSILDNQVSLCYWGRVLFLNISDASFDLSNMPYILIVVKIVSSK